MKMTKILILLAFIASVWVSTTSAAISRLGTVTVSAPEPVGGDSDNSLSGVGVSANVGGTVGSPGAFFGIGSVNASASALGEFWFLQGYASASASSAAGQPSANSLGRFFDEITISSPIFDGTVGSILVDLRYHADIQQQGNGVANGRFEFRIASGFGSVDANFDLVESGETLTSTPQQLLFVFGQKLFVRAELQTYARIDGTPVPVILPNGMETTFFRHDGSATIDARNTAEVLGFAIRDADGNLLDESQYNFASGSGTSPAPVPIPPALGLFVSGLIVLARRVFNTAG